MKLPTSLKIIIWVIIVLIGLMLVLILYGNEWSKAIAGASYMKACAYSLKGDKKNSLENLSYTISFDSKYKEKAKKDDAFKSLWEDEDFKKLVN
ncbi:MAG: hypothetical protein V1701_12235 [Planctomycetota bacterium]